MCLFALVSYHRRQTVPSTNALATNHSTIGHHYYYYLQGPRLYLQDGCADIELIDVIIIYAGSYHCVLN